MNLRTAKVFIRRKALECLVRYNDKMKTKDIAMALNVDRTTIMKDIKLMENVWQQDNYLYYGERL